MKLPVFKAVGMTFAFVFGHFGEIAKVLWLPTAILAAASAWVLYQLVPVALVMLDFVGSKPEPAQVLSAIGPVFAPLCLLLVLLLIFVPMQYAGVLRYLIKGEKANGLFYLRFGRDELNILITYVLMILIGLAVSIVFGIAEGIVKVAVPAPAGELVRGIVNLVERIVSIWIDLHLALAFAAAVAIGAIGIGRSWSVTKGNLWALLGYYIIFFLILIVVLILAVSPFVGRIVGMIKEFQGVAGDQAAVVDLVRRHLQGLQTWMSNPGALGYAIIAVNYVINLVLLGFQISAPGVAYRLITADDEDKEAATA